MRRGLAAAAAFFLAAAGGADEPAGFRLDHYRAPVPDTVRGGTVLHTAALRDFLAAHADTVLIDVLPAPRRPPGMPATSPWLPLPRHDIPGSQWLPDVGRGALAPAVEAWFATRLASATAGDHNRPVVFYCLANCWMSWNATKRAVALGYTHAIWDPDGTDGWTEANLPTQIATPDMPPM